MAQPRKPRTDEQPHSHGHLKEQSQVGVKRSHGSDLAPEYFRARLTCGADRSQVPRITIERTCIYFDWSGAMLIPKSFAKLYFFVCAEKEPTSRIKSVSRRSTRVWACK
jgi:hypothetical protein